MVYLHSEFTDCQVFSFFQYSSCLMFVDRRSGPPPAQAVVATDDSSSDDNVPLIALVRRTAPVPADSPIRYRRRKHQRRLPSYADEVEVESPQVPQAQVTSFQRAASPSPGRHLTRRERRFQRRQTPPPQPRLSSSSGDSGDDDEQPQLVPVPVESAAVAAARHIPGIASAEHIPCSGANHAAGAELSTSRLSVAWSPSAKARETVSAETDATSAAAPVQLLDGVEAEAGDSATGRVGGPWRAARRFRRVPRHRRRRRSPYNYNEVLVYCLSSTFALCQRSCDAVRSCCCPQAGRSTHSGYKFPPWESEGTHSSQLFAWGPSSLWSDISSTDSYWYMSKYSILK
jgi:hypothetical protein